MLWDELPYDLRIGFGPAFINAVVVSKIKPDAAPVMIPYIPRNSVTERVSEAVGDGIFKFVVGPELNAFCPAPPEATMRLPLVHHVFGQSYPE
jgi:hypothetical protein